MELGDTADTWLDLPPTPRQTRWALAVAAVALAGFAAVVPIADRPLTQLNAFFPSLDAIVFVSDLVTAVLLYAQFAISRLRGLLALAAGYLFTALIVIPHALTFAGAFSPTGLLGANIQTGSWLFIFWHIGFSAGLLSLCGAEGRMVRYARFPGAGAAGNRVQRGRRGWAGLRPDLARDCGRDDAAADHSQRPAPHQPDCGLSHFVRDPDFAGRTPPAVAPAPLRARPVVDGGRTGRNP
jgi:hypothetical protein